jgi:hypothetical protein
VKRSTKRPGARIEHRALVAPLYNYRVVHVISERAGNYQFHPYWDVLLDQIWVR